MVPPGPALAVAGLSLAGVLLVLLGTSKYGPGLWPDGTDLLWSAKNLVAGRGFLSASGEPMTAWPPLFPAIAALPGWFGVEPWTAVRFINATCFGLTVLLSGLALLRLLEHRSLAIVGTAAVFLSHPLAAVSVMAWPETVCYLLVLAYLAALARFCRTWTIGALVLTGAVGAAAGLAHYSAVSLPLAAVAAVLVFGRRMPLSSRAGYAAALAGCGLLPVGAWMVRNVRLTGALAGARVPVTRINFAEGILTALREWFFPPALTAWLGVAGLALALGLVVLLAIVAWRSFRGRDDWPARFTQASVIWLAAFGALLFVPEPPMNFDPIPDRVLVPAFVTVVVLLFIGLDRLAALLARRLGNPLVPELAVLALAIVWLAYPLTHVSRVYAEWVALGAGGYNADQWRESPTIRWLRAGPPPSGVSVWSNDPLAIRLLAGQDAGPAPRRAEGVADFARRLGAGRGCLVWFGGAGRSDLLPPDEIGRRLAVRTAHTFPDAAVYSVEPGPPQPEAP